MPLLAIQRMQKVKDDNLTQKSGGKVKILNSITFFTKSNTVEK